MDEPGQRGERREVRLDPALQEKLLQQMRAEADSASRTRQLRRYVVLPLSLLGPLWCAQLALSSDMVESSLGGSALFSFVFLGWKLRKQLPTLWGLD